MRLFQRIAASIFALHAFASALPAMATDTLKVALQNPQVEKLSTDQFTFLEGPAFDGGHLLYFTDMPANAIYTYDLASKQIAQFMGDTHNGNGLLFNREGKLLLCEQDAGLISAIDLNDKSRVVITSGYEGKRFNRPNDLVMDKSNGIYFSDPSWAPSNPQPLKGVYYTDDKGSTALLVADMDKPNGVVLTADEKYLYVDDSGSDIVRRYPVLAPGKLGEKVDFAKLPGGSLFGGSGADGVAIDVEGRLFVTYRQGIAVFDAKGKMLGNIPFPEQVSNCTFAGKDMNELYVTGRKNLYRVTLPTRGLRFPQ